MATELKYPKGYQFFSNTGAILSGGKLSYYEAGTTTHADTYSNAAGSVVNTYTSNKIILNSAGRLTESVYLGSATDYKERLETSTDVQIFEEDDIPAAPTAAASVTSAAPLTPWTTKSADETLTTSNFCGKAIAGDTSSGNVTLTLPSAASAGNGLGGIIKKSASANSLVIARQLAETIDGATSITLTAQYHAVWLVPDGANWKVAAHFLADGSIAAANLAATFLTGMTALTSVDRAADYLMVYDASATAHKKVLAKYIDNREPNALHSLMVLDKDLTTPPGSPSAGDRYIVASGATGDWAGQAGNVASYFDGAWAFYTPTEGWLVWVADEDALYYYTGSVWDAYGDTFPAAGISTPYGASCRLKYIEQETTLSGATTAATTQIPISTVLGVSVRVTQVITGSGVTAFTVGNSGGSYPAADAARFGSGLGLTVGTTNKGHIGPTGFYDVQNLLFTATGGSFTGGKVRSGIWYLEFTPATS